MRTFSYSEKNFFGGKENGGSLASCSHGAKISGGWLLGKKSGKQERIDFGFKWSCPQSNRTYINKTLASG